MWVSSLAYPNSLGIKSYVVVVVVVVLWCCSDISWNQFRVKNSNFNFFSRTRPSINILLLTGYISTAINDGPGCLMLRCPDPSCAAAVGQDMINALADDDDKEKYGRYLRRSYIEDNRKVS